jgi:TorA maturation chaperone TorD
MNMAEIPKPTETPDAELLNTEGFYLITIGSLLAASPEHAQLIQLASEEVFSAIPFAQEQPSTQEGARLLVDWASNYDESQLDALKSDYLRLFEGPGMPKAPPWESVYTGDEGRLIFQKETLLVREWFKTYGLQIRKLYKEPDDNIAYELQFIGHLTTKAAASLEAGETDKTQQFLEARNRFCEEHLLCWAFEWCTLAAKEAATPYYKGVAYLVEGILVELRQQKDGA